MIKDPAWIHWRRFSEVSFSLLLFIVFFVAVRRSICEDVLDLNKALHVRLKEKLIQFVKKRSLEVLSRCNLKNLSWF